ncbi:MAG: DUF4139 domain-containing protein [Rhodovibrionaceae bacterium]
MKRALTASCALLALSLFAALPAGAAEEREVSDAARQTLTLTVYQNDIALVRDVRRLDFAVGENRFAIGDVSQALRPETLSLTAGAEGLTLHEQSYERATLTQQALLEAAVGGPVRLVRLNPETGEEIVAQATLLSLASGPILQVGDRIEISPPGRIVLERLPEGLRAEPALLVSLDSASAQSTEVGFSYLTGGLGWQADYIAELDGETGLMDLTGYVTVTNGSGIDYQDAGLRLVAGDVNVASASPRMRDQIEGKMYMSAAPAQEAAPPQSVSNRYLYAIERPVTLKQGETKQLVLFSAEEQPVERVYRFDNLVQLGGGELGPVNAGLLLRFDNDPAASLGMPLPAGTIRVYENLAGSGSAIFAGEDYVAHTAEGQEVELRVGAAFDVTAEARGTDFDRLSDKTYESAQEIVLSNAQDKPVTVEVAGALPQEWKMLQESHPHEEVSANQVLWRIEVPAKGESVLTYRVRISNN